MQTITRPSETESPYFPTHTLESAPAESRPFLEGNLKHFGFIPKASARHASAPAAVEAFTFLLQVFERTSLSPLQREVVALVLARSFDCKLCRELHAQLAAQQGASSALVGALLRRDPISEPPLAALAAFTERVIDTHGKVSDQELEAFFAADFTPRHALEIVVGIATYTLSIFANRMTRSETLR